MCIRDSYSGLEKKNNDRGIYFQYHDSAPVISTLSEPYYAHTWFPCKDRLGDKADSVDINITVPSELKAVSNGTLVRIIENYDGTCTYCWQERYPIAVYLISLAISDYTYWSENYFGIDGFSSVFAVFVDGNISYALTSNGTNFNNNNISIAVLSVLYNRPYDIPVFSAYHVSPEELDSYLGVYVSARIPIKITITRENNTLIGQGTGQPSFPLEPSGKDVFKFDQAGVVMEFNPANGTMILKQGGGQFEFKRE